VGRMFHGLIRSILEGLAPGAPGRGGRHTAGAEQPTGRHGQGAYRARGARCRRVVAGTAQSTQASQKRASEELWGWADKRRSPWPSRRNWRYQEFYAAGFAVLSRAAPGSGAPVSAGGALRAGRAVTRTQPRAEDQALVGAGTPTRAAGLLWQARPQARELFLAPCCRQGPGGRVSAGERGHKPHGSRLRGKGKAHGVPGQASSLARFRYSPPSRSDPSPIAHEGRRRRRWARTTNMAALKLAERSAAAPRLSTKPPPRAEHPPDAVRAKKRLGPAWPPGRPETLGPDGTGTAVTRDGLAHVADKNRIAPASGRLLADKII